MDVNWLIINVCVNCRIELSETAKQINIHFGCHIIFQDRDIQKTLLSRFGYVKEDDSKGLTEKLTNTLHQQTEQSNTRMSLPLLKNTLKITMNYIWVSSVFSYSYNDGRLVRI